MGDEAHSEQPRLYGKSLDAPLTVLVLDDTKSILHLLNNKLTSTGYAVHTASNIEDAVKIMNSYGADVGIIDYGLGNRTGFDAMNAIRRKHWLHTILMSARTRTVEGRDLAIESNLQRARAFVEKGTSTFLDDIVKEIQKIFLPGVRRSFTYVPGEMVGRYRMEAQWGVGGIADVYKAVDLLDTTGNNVCAFKLLRSPSNLHGRRLFLSMAAFNWDSQKRYLELCKRLSNSPKSRNLVRLRDYGMLEGYDKDDKDAGPVLYIVEEFIDGPNLRQYLDAQESGVLVLEDFLEIFYQTASGLQKLHEAKLAHRDIVPHNILLENMGTSHPRIVITDFGSMRHVNASQGPVVMSSFSYTAPEQLLGKPGQLHADRWALGICMYEAITGVRPFQTTSDLELRGNPLPIPKALERDEKLANSILHDSILPPSEMKRGRIEEGKIVGKAARETVPVKIDNIIMNLLVRGPERMKVSSVINRLSEVYGSFKKRSSKRGIEY